MLYKQLLHSRLQECVPAVIQGQEQLAPSDHLANQSANRHAAAVRLAVKDWEVTECKEPAHICMHTASTMEMVKGLHQVIVQSVNTHSQDPDKS